MTTTTYHQAIAAWSQKNLCLDKHYVHGKKVTDIHTCTRLKNHPEPEHTDGRKKWSPGTTKNSPDNAHGAAQSSEDLG